MWLLRNDEKTLMNSGPHTQSKLNLKFIYFRFRSFDTKIEQLPCSAMNAPFSLGINNFEGTLEADSWSFESTSQVDSDTFSDVSMIDSDDEVLEGGEGTGQGLRNRKLHTLQIWDNNTNNILCPSQIATQQVIFDHEITSIVSDDSRINNNERREKHGSRRDLPLVKTDDRTNGF